ncbi:trichome birefringence-like protein 3 [Tanacetum coccineum]
MENDSKNNQTGKGLLRGSKSKDVDHKAVGKDGLPSGMVIMVVYRHDHIEGNPSSKLGFESLDISMANSENSKRVYNQPSHQAKEFIEVMKSFVKGGEAVRSDFYEVEQVNLENEEEVLKHDKSQEAFNLASDHTMKDKGKNEGWASNEAKAFQSSTKPHLLMWLSMLFSQNHENSKVGFFVGKKVAFQLVKNYVTNTWAKFGFQRIMSDDEGLLYFQFKTSKGAVWLNFTQSPSCPVQLSKLVSLMLLSGKPLMLDAFTNTMCTQAWGRVGYARALIEVHAEKDLKKEIIMAVPNIENESEEPTMITIPIDYEWKPPHCLECRVFGHTHDQCPKSVIEKPKQQVKAMDTEGFTTVTNRKNQGKKHVETKVTKGFKVNNKPTVRYQVVRDNNKGHNTIAVSKDGIEVNNVFEKLYDLTEPVESTKEDNEGTASLEPLRNTGKNQISSEVQNVSDDDEVDEEIHDSSHCS